jgi:hypothetical protein
VLRLTVNLPTVTTPPTNVTVNALLDGGNGIDGVFTTANVVRVNVP